MYIVFYFDLVLIHHFSQFDTLCCHVYITETDNNTYTTYQL